MALARTYGVVLSGIDAHLVEVEAHLSQGLPGMSIVGLADTAVGEARDRVRAAVINSGARWPQSRITVGLSPASLHKRGSVLDLAIATAILAADGQVPGEPASAPVLFGELGLDGRVRPVRGVVVAAVAAVHAGRPTFVVAAPNRAEAALVPGLDVVGVATLGQWCARLSGRAEPDEVPGPSSGPAPDSPAVGPAPDSPAVGAPAGPGGGTEPTGPGGLEGGPDLADVRGQPEAVSALQIAAVGSHHVCMIGRPGVGKTMLAERLPSILPDLDDDDALTATAIRSLVADVVGLVRRPPFQAPHHTATVPALVGGGRGGQPSPGAVTLAHAGVLFLDEAAEFSSAGLEALRQPLESGEVSIARSGFTARMPARFQLVLAANPCPCGMGDGSGEECHCRSIDRRRYLARLSGPLMDRIDVHLALATAHSGGWAMGPSTSTSVGVRAAVTEARDRGRRRLERLGLPTLHTGGYPSSWLRGPLSPHPAAVDLLSRAVREGRITGRGADRSIRVAWSVADLDAVCRPGVAEVGRALTLRGGQPDG